MTSLEKSIDEILKEKGKNQAMAGPASDESKSETRS
jgi:hypothetical protein